MGTAWRATTVGGLALSAALHILAAWALLGADSHALRRDAPDQRAVLLLVPAPLPASVSPPASAPAAAAPAQAEAQASRAAVRYYYPEELERELIVLRDRTGDAAISLPGTVILQLFVDAQGKVVLVRIEGAALAPALARQLRAAFGAIEFLPGMKDGQPVPARLRIALTAPASS
jgi:outer membrane biosynthesis protein TonB